MASSYEKTRYPGIYKRGKRFYVRQRDASGRMVTRTATTIAEAQAVKADLKSSQARGAHVPRPKTFADYADKWIEEYGGRTSRGFREHTRDGYRAALNKYAKPFFGTMQLSNIQPRDIKAFAQHLADQGLSKGTIRRHMAPVKALLATAFEDGLIQANPAAGVRIALPGMGAEESKKPKALSDDELARLIDEVDDENQLLVRFMAQTGMRIGEVVAVQWHDVDLTKGTVRVERAAYQGELDEPKSRYSKRAIPLTKTMVKALKAHRAGLGKPAPESPLFPTDSGTMMDPHNIRSRIIGPAAKRADVPWATPHTLRHTFASRCFREGCNVKQVQAMLGHHSPAFTLDTYVHLLPEDLPDLGFLDA